MVRSDIKKILWYRTSIGEAEIQKLRESARNEKISQGSVTEEFESKIARELNVPYAIATTSGSVALLMVLISKGIGPGDEVIVPNRTWIATAHAALLLGAKVVLVDVLPDVPLLDVSQVRNKITSRTKAIIPVHLNGRSTNMEEIQIVAKENDLIVVEDACQALFSKNSAGFLGTQSDAGCFSLGITKLISTGQGGFIVTKSKDTYEKLKLIRNNGTVNNVNPVYNLVGLNFKFTDLMASIGIVQLSLLDKKIEHVKKVYEKYVENINELTFLKSISVKVSDGEVPIYMEVLCKERTALMKYLESVGIQTRPFLPNLDSAPYLKNSENFQNSNIFSEQGIFLPSGPSQSLENVERVIEALKSFKEK